MTEELPKKLSQKTPKDVLPGLPMPSAVTPILPDTMPLRTETAEHATPVIGFFELASAYVQAYARNYVANLFQSKGLSGMTNDLKTTLTGIIGGIVILLTQVFGVTVPTWIEGTIIAILVVVFGYLMNKPDKPI